MPFTSNTFSISRSTTPEVLDLHIHQCIMTPIGFYEKSLCEAAASGNDEIIRDIAIGRNRAALINLSEDQSGHSPLYIAVQKGHATTVALLVEFGADVNARTRSHKTPLYEAARLLTEHRYDPLILSDEPDEIKIDNIDKICQILFEHHAVIHPPLSIEDQREYAEREAYFKEERAKNHMMIVGTLNQIVPNHVAIELLRTIADFAQSPPPIPPRQPSDCTIL